MVESQQDQDNEQDYADQEDECDNDLDTYLRSEYLDNCNDLYNNDNADNDSNSNNSNNNPASPAMSTYSRPLST